MQDSSRLGEKVYRGIGVSAGTCRGQVVLLSSNREAVARRSLDAAELDRERLRLEEALFETRKQILETQRQVSQAMGAKEASIFEAHLLVLEDQTIIQEVDRLIQTERVNAEYALSQVSEKFIRTLSEIDDEYLRERAKDMRDVINRVLDVLQGRRDQHRLPRMSGPCVIVSEDLTPSITAHLDRSQVLGFATDIGSKTSHTAILARSLGIPAIVGLQQASHQLRTGQQVLLDGYNGLLILNPTDQALFQYGQLEQKHLSFHQRLQEVHDLPAITLDGGRITLSANVEQAADCEAVLASGAEGVGLFRTEFLFINRDQMPGEEEQYQAYRQVAANLKPQPVVIRTLDLGGDKFLSHLKVPYELNPFLGWRAIRVCLQEKEFFRNQLRAILRASTAGNVKMMYPMISVLEEWEQADALLTQCQAELRAENIPFNADMEVGVMIEVPSAVMIAESLAKRVDFFSIGTNDLIQYSLAVDRMNEKIAHLYSPTHPAIVRLIKLTVEAAHRHNIWVGVCGEMAADPVMVPLLLGLGVDELSTAALLVPEIKFLIRRLSMEDARQLADFALQSEAAPEILARCQQLAHLSAPSLFEDSN